MFLAELGIPLHWTLGCGFGSKRFREIGIGIYISLPRLLGQRKSATAEAFQEYFAVYRTTFPLLSSALDIRNT